MTRRFWQFSLIALIGTIIVATALAVSYQRLSIRNLTEISADKNTALARSLANTAHDPLNQLLLHSSGLNIRERRALASSSDLDALFADQITELSVVKINFFNRNSLTVFSTDSSLIGIRLPHNSGIIEALKGNVVSDIIRKNNFNYHDQVIEKQDLMQTYIPFHDSNGDVVGVFEIYSDITPLLSRISDTRLKIVSAVSGILAIFLASLVWLYGRTDQKLVRERMATCSYLEQIETANATLETRVAERTKLLEESRKFLQTAIDGVPDPAIVVNTDYQITSMNKAALDAFADAQTDDGPLLCYQAMRGLDAPCDDLEYPCTITSGMPCKKIQGRKGPNGHYQQIEFRTTPLRGPNGEITGAIEIAHDLNEREQINYKLRRAKERAEAANQVKSEFVATMSHEIRTPLNAVLGMTDLLRLTNLTRKQRGYIETIQSSGNMLLSLVDNILDFSRLGAGVLEIQRREFSVLELLERVLSIMGYHAYSKGLELLGILDADLSLRVSGDRSRLRQILVNLARNAVKFSDEGEVVIRISVDSTGDGEQKLSFAVTDCGVGMSDEVKARLFTPFTDVRRQPEGRQGSGLGLTICKQLIEQMGGEIGIDSEPGRGTRVRFSVPVEWKTSAGHEQLIDYLALKGKRILTVHGNTEIDQAVCSYAMAFGMRCDIAASDDEAMQRLAVAVQNGQPYTAVVIDSTLLPSSALALARRIRDADKSSRTGIALLTPISESFEPGTISSIGRIRCVNKPVLPSELLQCLLQLDEPDMAMIQDAAATDDGDEDNAQLRILVAEDNPVNRQVLTGMLESLGQSADCVEDGPTALEVLSESPYDIVLMDCQMPGMDGEQVTKAIRNGEQALSVQPVIIAVTADPSLEHQSACRAAGMDDFIAKPIRLGELRKRLQKWKSILLAKKEDAQIGWQDQNPHGDEELLSHLHQRTGVNDELFLSTYIDLFLQDTAARLNKLSDAMDSGDTAALMRECHTLKGACLEFGMSRMGRYCDDIRDSAADRNLDVIPQLLVVLKREFERIRPIFEAEKAAQLSRSRPDR